MYLDVQQRLAGRLLPAERILWAGQPETGLLFEMSDLAGIAFALFWMVTAVGMPVREAMRSGRIEIAAFSIPFLVMGLYLLIGRFLHDAWLRRRTFYALTDQRILIWRDGAFSRFQAVDRRGIVTMDLKERGERGTISFFQPADATRRASPVRSLDGCARFYAIRNSRAVFDLIQRTRPAERAA